MTKDKLTKLIKEFNFNNPTDSDFKPLLPFLTGEIKDIKGVEGNVIGKLNAIKTLWELSQPEKPKARSRVWKSSNGYIYLIPWSNASLLRIMGTKWFSWFKSDPKSPLNSFNYPSGSSRFEKKIGFKLLDRLEGQFLDELRSVIANIEEGFARPTTSEYLQFIGYSQGSLKEAKGDIQRLRQDGFLKSTTGTSLAGIGIDLKKWHEALKETVVSKPIDSFKSPLKSSKGSYRTLKDFSFNYPPIDNLNPSELTYEIFIELINKTDWHLRHLVESLEKKLDDGKMGYKSLPRWKC